MRRMGVLLLGMVVTGCASARTTDRVYAFQQPVSVRDGGARVAAAADWAACDRTTDRVAACALLGTLLLGLVGGLTVGAGGGQFEATQEIALMRRPGRARRGPPVPPPRPTAGRASRTTRTRMRRRLRSRGDAIDAPPGRRGFTP